MNENQAVSLFNTNLTHVIQALSEGDIFGMNGQPITFLDLSQFIKVSSDDLRNGHLNTEQIYNMAEMTNSKFEDWFTTALEIDKLIVDPRYEYKNVPLTFVEKRIGSQYNAEMFLSDPIEAINIAVQCRKTVQTIIPDVIVTDRGD